MLKVIFNWNKSCDVIARNETTGRINATESDSALWAHQHAQMDQWRLIIEANSLPGVELTRQQKKVAFTCIRPRAHFVLHGRYYALLRHKSSSLSIKTQQSWTHNSAFNVLQLSLCLIGVTDLINALPGNSSVNTVQHATIEKAVFSVDPTDAPIYWLDSDHVIYVYCRSMSILRLYNESREL
jgi:hypothetical protein